MEKRAKHLFSAVVASILMGLLGGSLHAWSVPFPGGEVHWGPGYGAVRFPYGDVRWGYRGGHVEFPGGAATWGPGGGGRVRINVPGFSKDLRW